MTRVEKWLTGLAVLAALAGMALTATIFMSSLLAGSMAGNSIKDLANVNKGLANLSKGLEGLKAKPEGITPPGSGQYKSGGGHIKITPNLRPGAAVAGSPAQQPPGQKIEALQASIQMLMGNVQRLEDKLQKVSASQKSPAAGEGLSGKLITSFISLISAVILLLIKDALAARRGRAARNPLNEGLAHD